MVLPELISKFIDYLNSLQPASVAIASMSIYIILLIFYIAWKKRKRITKDMFMKALDKTLKTEDPCGTCVNKFNITRYKKKKTCYWCRKLIIRDHFAWLRLTFDSYNCACPCSAVGGSVALHRARLLVKEYRGYNK